jgi:hypothetical protein
VSFLFSVFISPANTWPDAGGACGEDEGVAALRPSSLFFALLCGLLPPLCLMNDSLLPPVFLYLREINPTPLLSPPRRWESSGMKPAIGARPDFRSFATARYVALYGISCRCDSITRSFRRLSRLREIYLRSWRSSRRDSALHVHLVTRYFRFRRLLARVSDRSPNPPPFLGSPMHSVRREAVMRLRANLSPSRSAVGAIF